MPDTENWVRYRSIVTWVACVHMHVQRTFSFLHIQKTKVVQVQFLTINSISRSKRLERQSEIKIIIFSFTHLHCTISGQKQSLYICKQLTWKTWVEVSIKDDFSSRSYINVCSENKTSDADQDLNSKQCTVPYTTGKRIELQVGFTMICFVTLRKSSQCNCFWFDIIGFSACWNYGSSAVMRPCCNNQDCRIRDWPRQRLVYCPLLIPSANRPWQSSLETHLALVLEAIVKVWLFLWS